MAKSYDYKVQRICDILTAPYIKLSEMNSDKICDLLNDTWKNRKDICHREFDIAKKQKEKVYEAAKMALDLLKE